MSVDVYVGIGIAIVVVGVVLAIFTFYQRRRYKRLAQSGEVDQIHDPAWNRVYATRKTALAQQVAQREAEEKDTSSGSQVWFSRYIVHGDLKHWVIIVGETKYELRQDAATKDYRPNVAPWSLDRERREHALRETQIPNVNGYYICLIGWTRLSPAQLESICHELRPGFGRYNLVFNNCQDFLKDFADRIVCKQALDWSWFRENVETEYRKNQKWPSTPPEAAVSRDERQRITRDQQTERMFKASWRVMVASWAKMRSLVRA